MDPHDLTRTGTHEWTVAPRRRMRVPSIIYASEELIRDME